MKHNILVIEDELSIRRFLKTSIQNKGYLFLEAKTGNEGLQMVHDHNPDVILLDLGLPDIDGIDVIKNLRTWTSTPIIILSARDQEADKIKALDMGADDYLSKPFSVGEMHARIRVALRHAQLATEKGNPNFKFGDINVDLINREVLRSNQKIQLTPTQYDILSTLISKANKIVLHKDLINVVWGEKNDVAGIDSLRIYIHQLRHKLEKNPSQPQYLKTEPCLGYRLVCDM